MNGRSLWALILIVAGVAVLLENLGIIPGNAWDFIWPLVLIALGLSFLFGRGRRPRSAIVDDTLSLDGATSARVTLSHGGGRLLVTAGPRDNRLYAGRFGGAIARTVRRTGDQLEVALRPEPRDGTGRARSWQRGGGEGMLDWTIAFNPSVVLTLSVETGAAKTDLDLSGLRVVELLLQTGVSATTVILPAVAGATRATIKAGVASVHLTIPAGVAARIAGQMGLGAFNVDERRFPRNGKVYESPDFASATNRIEVNIEGGLGAINVG